MKKLLFASAASDGVYMHRISEPAKHIEGSHILNLGFQAIPGGFSHIVFNSVFTYTQGKQADMLAICRKLGLKIVLDIDDIWHTRNREYAKDVEYCISAADVVWCASKALVQECSKLNKNCHYIPNAAPAKKAQPKGAGKKFGYVAYAKDHFQDAKELTTVFGNLAKDKMPGASVFWAGFEPSPEGKKMFQLFESAKHFGVSHYQRNSAYWWHYNNFDTALAPLQKTAFNTYKSALKGIESGVMGCAFICSDLEPYSVFEHKTNCLKAGSKAEWWSCFLQLHNDPKLALELSENLQELVLDLFDPIKIAENRLQTLD